MIKTATIWLCALLGTVSMVCAAPSADLSQVLSVVEKPFRADGPNALSDFSAQFTQQSRIAALDTEQKAVGQLWFQYDRSLPADGFQARFRWIYTEPSEQLFVSDGQTIWVYLPEANQVIVSPTTNAGEMAGGQNPVTLLTALADLTRDFKVDWLGEGKTKTGDYLLQLTPKQPSPYLSSVTMTVDGGLVDSPAEGAYFPLKGLTVDDETGNRTEVSFGPVELNKGLAPLLFKFEPPAGVDVLTPEDLNPGG